MCNHTYVDRYGRIVAHASHFSFLKRPQQLDLERRWQFADLVEKQRPTAGLLEQPFSRHGGASERSARMAKKLAFEQLLGDRATVHGHEWLGGTGTGFVDEAGDELFAGSAGPGDEHRAGVTGDPSCEGDRLLQGGAVPDDARWSAEFGDLVAQPPHLLAEALTLDCLAKHEEHLIRAERFLDEVVRAALDGVERRVVVAVRAHHDDERPAGETVISVEERQAVHAGHPHVAEHQIGVAIGQHRQRLGAVGRRAGFVSLRAEDERQCVAQSKLIVDDNDVHDRTAPAAPE